MIRKQTIAFLALTMSVLTGIFILCSPQSPSYAEDSSIEKIVKFGEVSIHENKTKIKVNYQMPQNEPILILTSPQFRNINLEALQKTFGKDNIGVDTENDRFIINLKENIDFDSNGEFEIETINQNKIEIQFSDLDKNVLADESFNNQEEFESPDSEQEMKYDSPSEKKASKTSNDNEEDPDSHWIRATRMMITLGNPIPQSDGSSIYPAIYFGSLNYALSRMYVSESVAVNHPDGNGRINNVTAANSTMIEVPKDTNPYEEQQYSRNNFYTATYGDGLVEKKYRGSQRNFTTTNLAEYASIWGHNVKKPRIVGPDFKPIFGPLSNIGMDTSSVKLYIRMDPITHIQEQRLTYCQIYDNKKIKVSTTQKFNKNNRVKVTISFKNVGHSDINNFTGYNFRDITFMKNNTPPSHGQDNKLRSLGKNQGVYATNENFVGRYQVRLNDYKDSPYAWAIRGTKSTFFDGKDSKFPWIEKSNELGGLHDSFKDIDDTGDKFENIPAGKPFINKNWDSGISMHTKNQRLNIGDSVSMSYNTRLDIEVKRKPHIELHHPGTEDSPINLNRKDENMTITGNWFDYFNKKVDVFYTIDDKNTTHGKKITSASKEQTPEEIKDGIPHEFELPIELSELTSGFHIIRVFAKSETGILSGIETSIIKINNTSSKIPQLEIDSPSRISSDDNPYFTKNEMLNISGSWSDSDSKSVSIYYELDPKENKKAASKTLLLHEDNPTPGESTKWKLPNYSIEQLNDVKTHQLAFTITDSEGNSNQQTFYFKHQPEDVELIVPSKISFGRVSLANNGTEKLNPKYTGDLTIKDYREKSAIPLTLTLHIREFSRNIDHGSQLDKLFGNAKPANEKISTTVTWQNKHLISDNAHPIFTDILPDKDQWYKKYELTHLLKQHLQMEINNSPKAESGEYSSNWEWSITNSL
ncbi:hypothetical protein [Companilactobacillus ginsenosidimutans]|uniref:Uncharacterized protein n=1 Tax=Companilactobacillus ginsenosidimutans TaxID=1007676 RepID=A0A0H4QZ98_9LACO|nr:hypothetical protein [Companilactobacillus ginsenosidimutans]AKP66805.1 hypothetical protein ABM34_03965 [Companilactobacillus ginsenosidimutans]